MRSPVAAMVGACVLGVLPSGPAVAAAPRCGGLPATIVGTAQGELITGTPGDDVIVAGAGSDIVRGRGGDDRICGGHGADWLGGGPGSDRLYGGPGRLVTTDEGTTELTGDTLTGDRGRDLLVPGVDRREAEDVFPDTLTWERAPAGVTVDLAAGTATGRGSGSDRIVARQPVGVTGSRFGDRLLGSRRADHLVGGPGADRVRGRAGDDEISLDPSPPTGRDADVGRGGPGDDAIDAGGGADRLSGGSGRDVLADEGGGADAFRGGSGPDLLVEQAAFTPATLDLSVEGGPGRDRLIFSTVTVNPTSDTGTGVVDLRTGRIRWNVHEELVGTLGSTEVLDLTTYGSAWTVRGTAGPEQVSADQTAGVSFWARGGDDVFSGSPYDDLFAGGPGEDRALYLGDGQDVCRGVEVFEMQAGGQDCETVVP